MRFAIAAMGRPAGAWASPDGPEEVSIRAQTDLRFTNPKDKRIEPCIIGPIG